MCIGPTIHYNAGRKLHTYIIVQELMKLQLCMEIGLLPRRISSLTLSNHNAGHNYVHVHVRTLVQLLHTHSGTVGYAPEKYNEP